MATDALTDDDRRDRRALIAVTPEVLERFRDPRIVLAIVASFGGAIALFVGYLGVSNTLDPGEQLPYIISGGIGGLFLLGVAATLLFSTDLGAARNEVRQLRHEIAELRSIVDQLADDQAASAAPAKAQPAKAQRPAARRSRT